MSSDSFNLLNEEKSKDESDTIELFPGNSAINLDSLDYHSEAQMDLVGGLSMKTNFFDRTEQFGEKEKKKRGRPRKNERNSPDSSQKRSKNCFMFYFNISKLFSFILF